MKKKILVQIGMAPMLVLFLLSCGQGEAMPQQTEIPSETVAETPEPTPASPGTPEELRRAIAQAGPGESDLKREYYEQLLSMDAFEEADYAALSGVYGELGEKALQRDMLEKALRLYPSREYAGQVSAIVVETDDSDARELYHRVDSLIKTVLSERDRRILLLRDYSGWEMADIAAELGLTEANVRVVLSRARRAVAKAYKSASHD